jgi:hypothetical protein
LATPSPNICICTLEAQADVIEVGMFTTKEGEGVVVEQLPAPRVGKMTFKLPLLSVPVIISASRLLVSEYELGFELRALYLGDRCSPFSNASLCSS